MPYCQHCGEHFVEMKPKTAHVRKCPCNPKIIEAAVLVEYESAAEVEVRELCARVTSYEDIFTEVDAFLKKRDLYVDWEVRPHNFEMAIKARAFDQPLINQNPEKIYPGWTGNFRGQICKADGTKAKESFWDLTGNMGGKFNLHFLKSGAGGWSSEFGGSGTIYVADFPLLQKKYHNKGFDERYNLEIQEQMKKITASVNRAEADMITDDAYLAKCDDLHRAISDIKDQVATASNLHKKFIIKKFKSELAIDLPELEMQFVNTDKYNHFKDNYQKPFCDDAPSVDVSEVTKSLNDIQQRVNDHIAKYAEHFI